MRAMCQMAFPVLETVLPDPRCCVVGTQIVERVLADYGISTQLRVTELFLTTGEYRRRMEAFVKANPDPSVTVPSAVLDQWEEEGAIAAICSDDDRYYDCVKEGGFRLHMILEVAPNVYLDPTLGQFVHRGLDVPPGVLMQIPASTERFGGMLPGTDIDLSYRLRPDVRMPPRYYDLETLEAEDRLRMAVEMLQQRMAS